MLIDTHAHLSLDQFPDQELDVVVERAANTGVTHIITVGVDVASSRAAVEIASYYPNVAAAVGIHPSEAAHAGESDTRQIRKLIGHPNVAAIGEIGLDFYRGREDEAAQRKLFQMQLEMAATAGLPVIVHNRNADVEVAKILSAAFAYEHGRRVVLHCFGGDISFARQMLDLGCYLSFTGTVTFKNAEALRETVRIVPLDRMMLETDSPFLAPIPFRGKRNEPAYVKIIAEKIAEVKNISLSQVTETTTANALDFFQLKSC